MTMTRGIVDMFGIFDIVKEKGMAFGSGLVIGMGGTAVAVGTSDVAMYIAVAIGNIIKAGVALVGM